MSLHTSNNTATPSTPSTSSPDTRVTSTATSVHQIKPEDSFKISKLGDLSFSPNGNFVAYRETCWMDSQRQYHLCIINTLTRATRRLTTLSQQIFSPQWLSDETRLYFAAASGIGKNNSDMQIWSVDCNTSKSSQITQIPGGISRFAIGQSEKIIYYTRHVESPAGDRNTTQIWTFEPATDCCTLLLEHPRYVTSLAVSPDEQRIALVTAPDQKLLSNEGESDLEILDTHSKTLITLEDDLWRSQALSPHAWVERPTWSPDSTRICFRIAHDGFPPELILADLSHSTPKLTKLCRPLECHPLKVAWQPNSQQLIVSASHRAAVMLLAIDVAKKDEFTILAEGDLVIEEFSVTPHDDRIAVIASTPDTLAEIFLLDSEQAPEQLSRVHAHTKNWAFPSLSRFPWTSFDSTPLEGTLELPPGYKQGSGPLPLLLILHGGPTAAAEMGRSFGIRGHTAFAAKGYAVFSPNFRGSTGYGDAFLTGLVEHTNAIELDDILSGIDALVGAGIADPKRLGMMGWSYGGYLVNCLLATNRFQAASSGAGAIEMAMQYGTMDTPGHTINLLGAKPWENPEEYQRSSPLYGLKPGIKTATLIHSGSEDLRVPLCHATTLHRILHDEFKTPCELVVYQGAGHGLFAHEHLLTRLTSDHAWFAKYLA